MRKGIMRSSVKIGAALAAAAVVSLPAAQPLLLTPLDREPGKVELPNVKAQAAPSAGYDGQTVPTYSLTNSWPKKVDSAPPKPAALAPSAPQQGRVNKIDAITIKQGVAR